MEGSIAHDMHIRASLWLVVKHPESKASFRLPKRFTTRLFANVSQSNLFESGMIPQMEIIIDNYVPSGKLT